MATRATIKIEGVTFARVYKHYDGYPEGMLPWLEEFNQSFAEARGDDPEYKFAQLLRSSVLLGDKYSLDDSPTTGYGVIPYSSDCCDDYEYTLHKDGSVTCITL